MTNEMEETGDSGIKERTKGPLLTLHPSSYSKRMNVSNESALHNFQKITPIPTGCGMLACMQVEGEKQLKVRKITTVTPKQQGQITANN